MTIHPTRAGEIIDYSRSPLLGCTVKELLQVHAEIKRAFAEKELCWVNDSFSDPTPMRGVGVLVLCAYVAHYMGPSAIWIVRYLVHIGVLVLAWEPRVKREAALGFEDNYYACSWLKLEEEIAAACLAAEERIGCPAVRLT